MMILQNAVNGIVRKLVLDGEVIKMQWWPVILPHTDMNKEKYYPRGFEEKRQADSL